VAVAVARDRAASASPHKVSKVIVATVVTVATVVMSMITIMGMCIRKSVPIWQYDRGATHSSFSV
jgi:hypothetical protein